MVEFKSIQIKYDDFIAVDRLNLSIEDGEFFTFLGPSGCGKTTTLRALVGFINPSAGQILIDGRVINDVPTEKRGIGIVFQSYALFPSMTVYENIAFGLKVQKLPAREIRERVLKAADTIAINESQLSRNVSELSGGQQQRVALARAIILEPKILCLDEPLSNLDAKLRIGLRSELKRLQHSLGITTLYVTHDQEEALTLSDRIAVFNQGTIEQVGTPREIYSRSATEFVCDFIGDINRLTPQVLETINRQGKRQLLTDREGFIRIECIEMHETGDTDVTLPGEIVDMEYTGAFCKYTFAVCGERIKGIEKSGVSRTHRVGDAVTLHLSTQEILQFSPDA